MPVYELFGGPTRETVPLYWSHCGTTRARASEVTGTPKLASYDDVEALGREVVERGYRAFKTNIVVPGDEPRCSCPASTKAVAPRRRTRSRTRSSRCSRRSGRAPAARRGRSSTSTSTSSREGCLRVRDALEPFDLLWLEVDLFDPAALALVRGRAPMPICSGENLYGVREFRPFLEAAALDVASVDVIWNGFHQAKKIADLAETHEVNCAPHNYYSHLATFIGAQWCAAIPNARILEFDVDDVPWRDELVTAVPEIEGGELRIPAAGGAWRSSRTLPSTSGPRRWRVVRGVPVAPEAVRSRTRALEVGTA